MICTNLSRLVTFSTDVGTYNTSDGSRVIYVDPTKSDNNLCGAKSTPCGSLKYVNSFHLSLLFS